MKRKAILIFLTTISIGLLVGCTNNQMNINEREQTVSKDTKPEVNTNVNTDNTKNSVNNVKEEQVDNKIAKDTKQTDKKQKNINNIENKSTTTSQKDSTNNSDININKDYTVKIYHPDAMVEKLEVSDIKSNNIDEKLILSKLKAFNIVDRNTKINSFKIQQDTNIGYLDLSNEFYNKKMGTAGETLMLSSIANTYIDAFKLNKLKLTIDGKNYESGHIIQEDTDYLQK